MPTPFDSKFWDEEEQALYEEMLPLFLAGLALGMDGGTEALPLNIQPLVNPNSFNDAAVRFARDYRYGEIKDITDNTRKQVQAAMVEWMQSGQSLDVLEVTMAGIFGEARAARIAATEVTRAFSMGNMAAWESTGFITTVEWMTASDELVCPICSEREGEHFGVEDVDAYPPNSSHVGCRCFTKPIVDLDLVEEAQRKALGL
jgi:SPP1 gp7 family putative phage head morphogenesis protein